MIHTTSLDSGWVFCAAHWNDAQAKAYRRPSGWLPAVVPGHVHLDLVENGIIRHPFEEMAELGCQWVDETDWTYKTSFRWAPRNAGDRSVIKFEGLDTVCKVLLNGELIGRQDNMFVPLEVDVTGKLKEGANELVVEFVSAVTVGRERRAAYFEKEGLATDTANFEERAFVRKAQFMSGWDWGPRLVSCGIWKPVNLLEGPASDFEMPGQPAVCRTQLKRAPDEFGESFEFVVDGQPFWARGANWIPLHSFPSIQFRPLVDGKHGDGTPSLRTLLETCKAMNFNMLRVWGGGLYESDEFYDLCDELGILVWQDFPFACSYYPDDDEAANVIRAEATYHVKRLRHHPCLAIWCGNNENRTMRESRWGGADKQPARFQGERLWTEICRQVVEEHDPGRPYIETSPIGSPPGEEHSNAGGYGDSHFWDVWHGRGDWGYYKDSTARFSSEFGFPSACGHRTWAAALVAPGPAVDDPISPSDPVVRWHDKTGRPFEYLNGLISMHYPEPKTLEEHIYFSQLNQRDAIRYAVEHYRRSEFCKGTLIWQINDCWPVQSWALIDSLGDWKAAAYELVHLYYDVLACLHVNGSEAEVWLINDSNSESATSATLTIFDSISGEQLLLKESTLR